MSKFIKSKTATLFMVIMLMITIGALMFTVSGCNNTPAAEQPAITDHPVECTCTACENLREDLRKELQDILDGIVDDIVSQFPEIPEYPEFPEFPEQHKHNYKLDAAQSKDATCSAAGVNVYKCDDCGEIYTVAIPQAAHTWTTSSVEATCTTQGYTLHECSVCHTSYQSDFSAPKHSFVESVVVEPTCTVAGYTLEICSRCDEVREVKPVEAKGHSYGEKAKIHVEPTCVEFGYDRFECDDCRDVFIITLNAKGHKFVDEVYTYATCETDGVRKAACSVCSETINETAPALGHIVDYSTLKAAPGYEVCQVYSHAYCRRCGRDDLKWYANDAKYGLSGEKDAAGVEYHKADFYDLYPELAIAAHKFDTTLVEVSFFGVMYRGISANDCTNACTTVIVCSVCSDLESPVAASKTIKEGSRETHPNGLGHTWEADPGEYVVAVEAQAKAATCTEGGYTAGAHLCARCEKAADTNPDHYVESEKNVLLGALGHTWERDENAPDEEKWDFEVKDATCMAEGSSSYICKDCEAVDESKPQGTQPKLEHKWFYSEDEEIPCKAYGKTDAGVAYYNFCTYECGTIKEVGDHNLHVINLQENNRDEGAWYGDLNRIDLECTHAIKCVACDKILAQTPHYASIDDYLRAKRLPELPEELMGAYANCLHFDYCPACYAPATENKAEYGVQIGEDYGAHVWVADKVNSVAPTCEDKGSNKYICSVCDKLGDDKDNLKPAQEVAPLGHDWEYKTQIANCTQEGYEYKECTRCGASQITSARQPKTDHSWEFVAWVTEPNCVEDGVATETCSVCGKSERHTKKDSYKDAKLHYGTSCGDHCGYCKDRNMTEESKHTTVTITLKLYVAAGMFGYTEVTLEEALTVEVNACGIDAQEVIAEALEELGYAFRFENGAFYLKTGSILGNVNLMEVRYFDEATYSFADGDTIHLAVKSTTDGGNGGTGSGPQIGFDSELDKGYTEKTEEVED